MKVGKPELCSRPNVDKYEDFVNNACNNPNQTFIVVDSFPRSGTNFTRANVLRLVNEDIVFRTDFHYLRCMLFDGDYIHSKNAIHLFPLRADILDSMASTVIQLGEHLGTEEELDIFLDFLFDITKETIEIALKDFKNLYLIRITNLENNFYKIINILDSYEITHKNIKDDFIGPIKDFSREAEIIKIRKVLLERHHREKALEIVRLYDKLLDKAI